MMFKPQIVIQNCDLITQKPRLHPESFTLQARITISTRNICSKEFIPADGYLSFMLISWHVVPIKWCCFPHQMLDRANPTNMTEEDNSGIATLVGEHRHV